MLSWPGQEVTHKTTFPGSCCAWGDVEKSPLDLDFGLQINCQQQKYPGEVLGTRNTTENKTMLMVFITGSLHCLLA